uniref:Uncharacterized protein n=1 Tax=Bicosoecida sp. CB-2014 TaxID=1486930 RepID=A0A7S1G6N3_9STRA|mmetsp:Transcript_17577/g.61811  ORF Transcript_17577/g.61811 Transcript_17577/m.61811 type:complete len:605 (+) Transcript_17577:446-2260(+)
MPTMSFLMRVTPPRILMPAVWVFTNALEEAVADLAGATEAEREGEGWVAIQAHLNLPPRLGGVGLRLTKAHFVTQYAGSLVLSVAVTAHRQGAVEAATMLLAIEGASDAFRLGAGLLGLTEEQALGLSVEKARHGTAKMQAVFDEVVWHTRFQELTTVDAQRREAAGQHRNKIEGLAQRLVERTSRIAGGWLRALPLNKMSTLTNASVRTALRLALSLDPVPDMAAAAGVCAVADGCGRAVSAREMSHHALACPGTSCVIGWSRRHNFVAKHIERAWRQIYGRQRGAFEVEVHLERRTDLRDDGTQHRDDVTVRLDGFERHIDVTVRLPRNLAPRNFPAAPAAAAAELESGRFLLDGYVAAIAEDGDGPVVEALGEQFALDLPSRLLAGEAKEPDPALRHEVKDDDDADEAPQLHVSSAERLAREGRSAAEVMAELRRLGAPDADGEVGEVPPAPDPGLEPAPRRVAGLVAHRRALFAHVSASLEGYYQQKFNKLVSAGSTPDDAAPFVLTPNGLERRNDHALPFGTRSRGIGLDGSAGGEAEAAPGRRRMMNHYKDLMRRNMSVTLLHYNTELYRRAAGLRPQWSVNPSADWRGYLLLPDWVP